MRIELDDAKRGPVPWSETLDFESTESGSSDLKEVGVSSLSPIDHEGEFTYAEPNYRLRGALNYRQRLSCHRCLVDFDSEVSDDFEYLLERAPFRNESSPDGVESSDQTVSGAGGTEIELSSDDLEVLSVDSDHIDTTFYVREQVLLHVPMKPLCRPDCKGLCSHCGIDLNRESCDCVAAPKDPRWSGLAALKEQLDS